MTTAEVVASVKPQTRVLYVDVTGETHNAIATDVPHLGYNQGLKRFSAFLNLVYLNDAGQAVKIAAAPMIGEVDDAYLAEAAVYTARHDVAWHSTSNKEELINDHLEVIKTHLPITIGWQVDPAALALLKSSGIDGDAGDWTTTGDGTGYPADAKVESAATPNLALASAQPTQPNPGVVSEETTPESPNVLKPVDPIAHNDDAELAQAIERAEHPVDEVVEPVIASNESVPADQVEAEPIDGVVDPDGIRHEG